MKINLNWRKWFRVVHRDFGYLFFGITIVYSLSGIALNHLDDWNPNYIITHKEIKLENPERITSDITRSQVRELMKEIHEDKGYKNHYFPSPNEIKIFIKGGSIIINRETGEGFLEKISSRPLFREMNYLHYNPVELWTWFSDVFAGALIILAITGLFLVRGAKGITGRGAWMTILGILIPIIILLIYFY